MKFQIIKSKTIMIQRQVRQKVCLCEIHKARAVQMGSCLSCTNKAPICETKGCIGFHEENQRAHNVLTLQQIRHIVSQYINSNIEKRAYLKKMVYEYFTVARKEVQRIFTEVYDSIDHFIFDDLIFHQDDKRLIDMLIREDYQQFNCQEIATILPKMIRSTDFEDGHFTHLRNYLIAQKEKVTSGLDSLLLNLPEFRFKSTSQNTYKFLQIAEQSLKDVNTQLINLTHRPKKLRIKYGIFEVIKLTYNFFNEGLSKSEVIQTVQGQKIQFVRLIGTLESLKDVQSLQLYCVWDVDENEFQVAVMEAITTMKYLREISLYTSYRVTSTQYMEDLIKNRSDIEVKVYKKDWTF